MQKGIFITREDFSGQALFALVDILPELNLGPVEKAILITKSIENQLFGETEKEQVDGRR